MQEDAEAPLLQQDLVGVAPAVAPDLQHAFAGAAAVDWAPDLLHPAVAPSFLQQDLVGAGCCAVDAVCALAANANPPTNIAKAKNFFMILKFIENKNTEIVPN